MPRTGPKDNIFIIFHVRSLRKSSERGTKQLLRDSGVLAYLNGVDLSSSLRGQVLLAKMFGTILAVGGGLALGPEGARDVPVGGGPE